MDPRELFFAARFQKVLLGGGDEVAKVAASDASGAKLLHETAQHETVQANRLCLGARRCPQILVVKTE